MRSRPRRAPWPRRSRAPTSSSGFRPRGRSTRRWSARWRTSRSSSRWPIPIRRSPPRKCAPCARTRSSPPGGPTIPNQVNNVLGFPYIFRGALDVRASTINDAMKIAAAEALARLAREDVPDEVAAAYSGERLTLRAGLHHPGAVRPAADLGGAVGRRQGGDGFRRRAQADSRHGRLQAQPARAPRPDRRRARADLRAGARRAEARRLCRGRGGKDDPRRAAVRRERLRHAGAGRPRGTHQVDDGGDGADLAARVSKSTTPGCRSTTSAIPTSSTRGSSATACSIATASVR